MLLAGNASAIGLGELRGQPALGDRIRLEISLLGAEKVHLDPACFRLVQPSSNGDLPWLKKAGLSVRKGTPPVLEIRSEVPLREPVLQIGVYIGCGHEVSREYVVMASPAGTVATPMVEPGRAGADVAPPTLSEVTQPAPPRAKKFVPREAEVPSRIVPRKPEKRPAGAALPDRLMLSDGTGLGGTVLAFVDGALGRNAGGQRVAARDTPSGIPDVDGHERAGRLANGRCRKVAKHGGHAG